MCHCNSFAGKDVDECSRLHQKHALNSDMLSLAIFSISDPVFDMSKPIWLNQTLIMRSLGKPLSDV
jgi:hypothetical protein